MATQYPNNLDNFDNPTGGQLQNSGSRTHSALHGDANDAIEAIEAELGITPSGAYATVRARLEAIEAAGAAVADGDKGDIVVSVGGTTWTIDASAVTSSKIADDAVTNAKLANVASGTIKGRDDAGTGDVEDLSAAAVAAMLPVATTSAKGLVPTLPNNAAVYYNGAGAFTTPAVGSHNHALAALSDIDLTGLQDGYVLYWDATAAKWKAREATFTEPTPTDPGFLPWVIDYTALGASSKKIQANYFPAFPINLGSGSIRSTGNNNPRSADDYYTRYTDISTSGGGLAYLADSGMSRDRPVPRSTITASNLDLPDCFGATIPTTTWRVEDRRTEIKAMIEAGIDVCQIDVLLFEQIVDSVGTVLYANNPTDKNNSYSASELLRACQLESPNIKASLWFDFSSGSGLIAKTANEVVAWIAGKYANYDDVLYFNSDGALYLGSGNIANWTYAKAKEVIDDLWNEHGIKATWNLGFLDWTSNHAAWETNMSGNSAAGYPYYMGESEWGDRNPDASVNRTGRQSAMNALSKDWQQPVSIQDHRPDAARGRIFDEGRGTDNLLTTMNQAITNDSQEINLVTWSDYGEMTVIAPTDMHGYSFLDFATYWFIKYKTGSFPTIIRDGLYIFHKNQHTFAQDTMTLPAAAWAASTAYAAGAIRSYGGKNWVCRTAHTSTATTPDNAEYGVDSPGYWQEQGGMKRRAGTRSVDYVEVNAFLTATATVNVNIGNTTHNLAGSAGWNQWKLPLNFGTIYAEVVRSAVVTTSVTSPHTVSAIPYRQDTVYHGTSSLRPTPAPVGMPVYTSSDRDAVISLEPIADVHTSAGSPTFNFGTNNALQIDGSAGTRRIAWLRFLLPKAPPGKTLSNVKLRVKTGLSSQHGSVATESALTFDIVEAPQFLADGTTKWAEGTKSGSAPDVGDTSSITNNNKASLTGATVLGTLSPAAQDTEYQVTLTTSEFASELGNEYCIAIWNNGSTADAAYLDSSHISDSSRCVDGPRLILTFT